MRLSVHGLRLIISAVLLLAASSMLIVHAHEIQVLPIHEKWNVKIVRVQPQATVPISGVLKSYQCHFYGQFYLDKGDIVQVTIYWTPDTATLIVGLYNVETSKCQYKLVTGGSANVIFNIWTTGSYYVFICNDSPHTVYYLGLITFE